MTQDMVKAMSDGELVQVIAWAQGEQKARADRNKRETIAKIKELAQGVGVAVSIDRVRGRPVSRNHPALTGNRSRVGAEKRPT